MDETDRLTALVSSVMELSKVTSGALKCEKVHFDMGQLCDEVSERYDAVCAQNGWQLKLEIPDEELPVCADPDMMQRALHNLLGNAMHHIGEDGIFVLRALRCPEGVRVEVEDHGPGISAEDLPISSTATTAPAPTRASRGPASASPSPKLFPAARFPLRRPQHCGQRHCVLVHHDRYRGSFLIKRRVAVRWDCDPPFLLFFRQYTTTSLSAGGAGIEHERAAALPQGFGFFGRDLRSPLHSVHCLSAVL